jgi:hypothetical protein
VPWLKVQFNLIDGRHDPMPNHRLIVQRCAMRRRRLEIYRRAVFLANTGKFDSWKEIQKELAKEGCERTFGLLASNRIRLALDVQCSKSRQPTESAGVGGSV